MLPLGTRQSVQTPPRSARNTSSSIHAQPSLVPLALGSSSPFPTALEHARDGARRKQADLERTGEQTKDGVGWRTRSRKERGRVSASEDGENGEVSQASAAATSTRSSRRATFDKVALSDRSSLAGSGQAESRLLGTSPRTSSYIHPHARLRTPFSAIRLKPIDPLAAFDRSACPEDEDSFYTSFSALSLDASPASTTYSTPAPSGLLPSFLKPSDTDSPLSVHLAAAKSRSTALSFAPPTSPVTLTSRAPYLNSSRFSDPRAIAEEDERSDAGTKSFADDPFESLSASEEAALGLVADVVDEDYWRSPPKGAAFVPPPGAAEAEVNEDACSNCGLEKNAAFVVLLPCRHPLCHLCVNALINGAAHKPPRPSDCFACAQPVESLEPADARIGIKGGGLGLVLALADVLEREQMALARPERTFAGAPEDGDESFALSRSRRRKRSIVAAAIAATILADSSAGVQHGQRRSRSRASTIGSIGSISSLPSSAANVGSFGGELEQQEGGEVSPLRRKSTGPPDLFGFSSVRASYHSDEEDVPPLFSPPRPPKAATGSVSSSIPPAVNWPVVRLDNLPWEVTAAEVESWVGEAKLASDLDEDALGEAGSGGGEKAKRVTLAVHILCNRADGRTLNQAYLECSSRQAARDIVRLKDGVKLRDRPVHVSLSSQGELLTTLFPTYTPGFATLEPNPNQRSKWASPIPLLLQTELTGLLNLCRLESAHAKKVAERPYFNIVSLLEKMPWSFPRSYNSQAIVRLFNTACAAIEILGNVKHHVHEWRDILTVLIAAILHCPVFRPQQKQKAVRLASNLGFQQFKPSTPAHSSIRGGADSSSFTPSTLQASYVGTAPDKSFLAAKQAEGALFADAQLANVGLPSPRFALEGTPSAALDRPLNTTKPTSPVGDTVVTRHRRRRSSVAAQLNIDKGVVESVAAALGIALEPSSA